MVQWNIGGASKIRRFEIGLTFVDFEALVRASVVFMDRLMTSPGRVF